MSTTTISTLGPRGEVSGLGTAPKLLPVAALLSATLYLACGGGGSPPSTPAGTSPAKSPAAAESPSPVVCSIDLSREPPDSLIYGADAGDFLADRFSLASGDFNGDGFDDALVGAPLADGPGNGRLNAGEAYVIFGSESPAAVIDLAQGAGLTIYGEAANDNMGLSVASGDVNGDGVDDILVGARFAAYQGRNAVGKTYVVYGRSGLTGTIDTALSQQNVTIVGRDDGDFSGIAVASGDVTGDGVADILIGASAASGPDNRRARAGEVYVVPGTSDLKGLIDLATDSPHFVVYGANPDDSLPNHIASGDINGNGRDELLLGAPYADRGDVQRTDSGEAYIIAVPSDGGSLDLAAGQGYTRITGARARDGFGHFTAAGDVNGDGLADAIMGARDADGPQDLRNNAGEVHVLLGRSDLPGSIDLAGETLDAVLLGIDAGDSLGFTVASGDLNGDGKSDILAGGPIAAGCGNARPESGEAYAVFGRSDLPPTIDLAAGKYDLSLFGAEAEDELGFSLATGDINGDGKDDIIAGALLADGPENSRQDAGEAYIILSR